MSEKPKDKKQTQLVFQKTKTAVKINPSLEVSIDFVKDPRLVEAFCVVIAGPTGVRQLTFHRPIGFHSLSAEDSWCLDESRDVKDLLERKEHPFQKNTNSERQKAAADLCVEEGLMTRLDDGTIVYPGGEEARTGFITAAKAAEKDHEKSENGYKPSGTSFMNFLPHGEKELEMKIVARKQEATFKKKVEERVPLPPYETKSGVLADKPQREIVAFRGMTRQALETEILRLLYQKKEASLGTPGKPTDAPDQGKLSLGQEINGPHGKSVVGLIPIGLVKPDKKAKWYDEFFKKP